MAAKGGGGGGGGSSQMQAMAQARDAMNQKVIDALDKLSAALMSGGGAGGAGAGGAAGSSGGGVGRGAGGGGAYGPVAPWQFQQNARGGTNLDAAQARASAMNAAKNASADQLPISALQNALTSGGMSGAASMLGGLAGGPAGLAGLALGAVHSQYQSDQSVKDAGFNSWANSAPHSSEAVKKFNQDIDMQIDQARRDDASNLTAVKESLTERNWFTSQIYGDKPNVARQSRASGIANLEETKSDFNNAHDGAVSRVESFFSRFAQAGMSPDRDSVRKALELAKMQTDAHMNLHVMAEEEFGKLILGAHGKHGGKQ